MNKRKIFLILSITSLYTLWALSSIIPKKNIPLTAVLSFPIMYVNIKLASNINNNIIEMNKFELDSYNKVTGNSSNLVNLKKSQTKNKK
ncbi:MAG: hypothetical protein PHC42_02335 [Bacilli bacterium]|nr:hypothetical protein [Bacilli bacterium]MDD4831384.1 hypothetical protein [Bacilli bacterium]